MSKNMNFSDALSLLKQGVKVCRIGWNGKDMFLYYVRPEGTHRARTREKN